jgi:hypothetical protein
LLATTPRAILCGGEERGTWLRENGAASDQSYAFALALSREPAGTLGTLSLRAVSEEAGELTLAEFFSALQQRRPLQQVVAPGLLLTLAWR